ncbi:MAG: sodium/solute symporter, partial [Gammaproteobacteria bacterium]
MRQAMRAMVLLMLGISAAARAESLATMRTTPLPPIQTAAPLLGTAAFDAEVVALSGTEAWRLAAEHRAWKRLDWQLPANTTAMSLTSNGREAYLLLGAAATRVTDRAAQLKVESDSVRLRELPALPQALRDAHAAIGTTLFVAGMDEQGTAHLARLDSDATGTHWQMLPGWPPAGTASSLAVQTSGVYVTIASADGRTERLWRWSAEDGWRDAAAVPGKVAPDSARAIGQAHVLYLVRAAGDAPAQLMSYHTITGSWATLPNAGVGQAQHAVAWGNGVLWATDTHEGRIELGSAEIESGKALLKWLDWLVIVVYLAGMIGIGVYFYAREKRQSTASFFVGSRTIPFWAAGVSLYAANTSSISYIAIPAKAFETNWQYMTNNLVAVVGLMFVAVWIVPLLRRLNLMSVFTYLETRFHPGIRMLASALAIATQIGSRMSVILFLPSLAIATITGFDVTWSILLMGVFTIIYTALGGMKAVVWTDVVQLIVKMGGALFAIGFIIWKLHGGVSEFFSTALAEHKMKLFDFSFDLGKATVWSFLMLVVFEVVLTFPKDQVLMQRTLSTRSDKEAGRSIWMFAAIMIPGGFVFYTIGTALFVFYKTHPERMNPLLNIDATFPMFIAAELPTGVTGLIIAGIFAAAMATLSGIINSVATLASVDFYEKLVKTPDQKKSVLFAEIMTVVAGLV